MNENTLALFTFSDPFKDLNVEDHESQICHKFPQKALFRQRARNKKEKEDFEPLKDLVIKKTISLVKCEDIGNENKQNDTASQQTEIESQCQEEKDQIKMEPK